MKSKRGDIFRQVEMPNVNTNTFDMSHDRKLSTRMGKLTPILVQDCLPGDKWTINPNVFMRFAPLIAPVMHRVTVYCHFFFVPNRIAWSGWEEFITGGEYNSVPPVWPYVVVDVANIPVGSLEDHMGLPVQDGYGPGDTQIEVSAIPFQAYQMIWNEYYRDQNLQSEYIVELQEGNNSGDWTALATQRYRSWQHDYFTSSLPWPQKGPESLLPIVGVGEIPVRGYTDANPPAGGWPQPGAVVRDPQAGTPTPGGPWPLVSDSSNFSTDGGATIDPMYLDLNNTNFADLNALDGSISASITELRRALALQTWLEKNARGGTRYFEANLVHWGVRSPDASLQRPEYIGGFQAPVKISEVLQTSETNDAVTPQGNMAGHGVAIGGGSYNSYYCQEHGYIIGIMSVRPESAYQQGVPRHYLRSDRFDYAFPEFAHIGEQPIYNLEIIVGKTTGGGNLGTFGYTPRYAEYKYNQNTVHGDFKTTLDFWHLGRKFATVPSLNESFIVMDPEETERIFAVQDGTDELWAHVLFDMSVKRKLPVFGTPRIM